MTAITPLESIHKKGIFGDHHKKEEKDLLRISEIKDLAIIQVVQYKKSNIKLESVKINKVRAYLNNASVQEWFIDVFAGREKLTLLMTIRSDSEYREAKQKGKLGAYLGLKLLYRGYK